MRDKLNEFRSRRLFQVAAVYAVVAWLAIQVATSTFPYLGLPSWLITAVIIVAIAGFPFALLAAWLQERGRRRNANLILSIGVVAAVMGVGAWRLTARDGTGKREVFTGSSLVQITTSPEVEAFPAFSPDGKQLVFSRETAGFKQLFARDMVSGEEAQLTNDGVDHIQPFWSPDGKTLLYVQAKNGTLEPADLFGTYSGGDVWQLDFTTRRTHQIVADAANPAFSPDGKRVAFEASYGGPRRLWIADAAGRNPRQVTTDASEAVSHILPRWSSDGQALVFQNIEKTKLDIRVVDIATGKISSITDDVVSDADPIWMPSGRSVVFTSPRGGGWNLWSIPVDSHGERTGTPQQLTTGAGRDIQPAASPDGKQIAYATLNQNADLWMIPVDSGTGKPAGEPRALIATTREDSRGAWSNDGKRIVFNSDRNGDMNLFVLTVGDKKERQITKGAGGDFQATWSNDMKRVVFFSSRSGNADIWTADLDGGLEQLTTDSAVDVNPVYSPDGKWIAFQSDRGGRKEVWLMNADGTRQRQLTTTGVGDHFMLWTSDGKALWYHGVGPEVLQVEIATGQSKPVRNVMGGAHMSLSPDRSRMIDVVDHKALWVTPIAGGEPVQVFAFPDKDVRIDYPRWSPDGRFVLFDRLQPTGGDIWVLKQQGR